MLAVRIPRRQWGKAWRAMIEIAPVRLVPVRRDPKVGRKFARHVAADPVYEVLPAHVELLASQGVAYQVVRPSRTRKPSARRVSSR